MGNGKYRRPAKLIAAFLIVTSAIALAENQQPAQRRVVVSIPDRKLVLIEGGSVVREYPTAVGAVTSPTPAGAFTIINRLPEPTWYGPKKVVPPGEDNPLGTRWLGLSRKGYGIHGTNKPASIGQAASHGCIRMRKADIEELFDLVRVGDPVLFSTEPLDEIVRDYTPVEIAVVTKQSAD